MELAGQARAAGQSIALAAGEFDPLHVGHVRYLQAAANEADVLVVVVSNDSADPAAGRAGYILEPGHRADLVAAMRCVDLVTVLDGTSVASLVSTLRPDVYCQDVRDRVDARASEAAGECGARVAVVGDPTAPSTEEVLARLAAGAAPDPSTP